MVIRGWWREQQTRVMVTKYAWKSRLNSDRCAPLLCVNFRHLYKPESLACIWLSPFTFQRHQCVASFVGLIRFRVCASLGGICSASTEFVTSESWHAWEKFIGMAKERFDGCKFF